MTISGFTYIKNGFEYGYPFLESIQSILPICDEMIVAVGESSDGTREAIEKLAPEKIKIIDTIWNMEARKNGKVFAQQANIALDNTKGDWAFHIQADEVIHEKDLSKIVHSIKANEDDKRVEGFILPFFHFWGSYDYIRTSRRIHKHEVRIFKKNGLVRSYADSQGFRKYSSMEAYENGEKGSKLRVKKIDAAVYHYNGVRTIEKQKKKMYMFDLLHTQEATVDTSAYNNFDYHQIDRVERFKGEHPKVMTDVIKKNNWDFKWNAKKAIWKLKDRIMQPIEDIVGFKIGEYKNYILIK